MFVMPEHSTPTAQTFQIVRQRVPRFLWEGVRPRGLEVKAWLTDDKGQHFEPTRLEVAINIRAFRRFEVAKALGVSVRQLDRFERGEASPTEKQISEIAMLLDFPIGFFFGCPLPDIEWNSFGEPFRLKANNGR